MPCQFSKQKTKNKKQKIPSLISASSSDYKGKGRRKYSCLAIRLCGLPILSEQRLSIREMLNPPPIYRFNGKF
jgi:hypothetical protein